MPRRKDTLPAPKDGCPVKFDVSQETYKRLKVIGFEKNLVITSLVRDLIDRAVSEPKKYFPD